MKTLLSLLLLFVGIAATQAQDKFITKNGYAKFYSEAPLEDIEAINNKVTSIIAIPTNEVVINVPINAFQFENSLMQEHFNENYLESEKYPSAVFKGNFVSENPIELDKPGIYEVSVKGTMTIHGVTKPFNSPATIEVNKNQLIAKTKFMIRVADFDIEIPSIVFKNIAEEVEVTVDLKYLPFKS